MVERRRRWAVCQIYEYSWCLDTVMENDNNGLAIWGSSHSVLDEARCWRLCRPRLRLRRTCSGQFEHVRAC
eukprot:349590-Rhodomonas_salina.2